LGVPLNSKENRDSEKHKMAKLIQALIFDGAVFELLVLTEERPIEPWLNL